MEIARAVDLDAKVLILDEPTAALTSTETDQLLKIIADLRQQGVGLVFITHRLQECRHIADRITVLRDGRSVGVLPAGASVAQMIELMVDRSIDDQYPRRAQRPGEVLLKVDKLTRAGVFSEVSFEVKAGEVVGIAGLVGAGRTEVVRATLASTATTAAASRSPAARCPEERASRDVGGPWSGAKDRTGQGLVLSSSVADNLGLATLRAATTAGFVDCKGQHRRAGAMCGALRVRISGLDRAVHELSGGNQQKVVIGKWLLADPKVLMLDEPT